eukprot:9575176-Alexandrium_andersonii.AAC.1
MAVLEVLRPHARGSQNPWQWGSYVWDSYGLAPTKAVDAMSLIKAMPLLKDLSAVFPSADAPFSVLNVAYLE